MAVSASTSTTSASEKEQVHDKVVGVSFNPTGGGQFTFENYLATDRGLSGNPGDVEMTGPGNILFIRSPATASWKFVTAAVKYPGDQFKVRVPTSGVLLVIRDEWKVLGTFPYALTVEANGEFFTSPDPVIANTDPSFLSAAPE